MADPTPAITLHWPGRTAPAAPSTRHRLVALPAYSHPESAPSESAPFASAPSESAQSESAQSESAQSESAQSHPTASPACSSHVNRIFYGDNLAALNLLADELAGQVRCIYLDPPYNTGTRFEHYDDVAAHGAWLTFMRERLVRLREMLHEDGLLVVQIDDRELAYLQVLLDEVMGRAQRVSLVAVKMSELSGVKMSHVDRRLPKLKEFLLIYGRRPDVPIRPIRVDKSPETLARYLKYYTKVIDNPDDPPADWRVVPIKTYLRTHGQGTSAAQVRAFQLRERHRVVYRTNNRFLAGLSFPTPTAEVRSPTGLRYIWWEGKQMLFLADHCEETLGDLWTDISTINLGKEGGVRFRYSKKPEALMARILALCTGPGDLVLDAFAGSGTTAAVAHKLGRRWVTIEQGEHCLTHVVPRLRAVVDGTDSGGITERVGWKGGGAFRCYRVESLHGKTPSG